jgi:hypothetical protein
MPAFANVFPRVCLGLAAATFAMLAMRPRGQSAATSFFLTGTGIGNGGNLGGLAGADNYCQQLCRRPRHANLARLSSTQAADGKRPHCARPPAGPVAEFQGCGGRQRRR